MKLLSSLALLLGFVPAKAAPKDEIDIAALMTAIAAVENTPNDGMGQVGERSRYQITSTVWQTHSDMPFSLASENTAMAREEVRRVVRAHIRWIRQRLPMLHYADTPYSIALVWKAGYGRCLNGKVRYVDKYYASRVAHILEDKAP